MDSAFTSLVADALGATPFRLLDVGCSGGLDPRWRAFGERLQAIGIDASRGECARLAKAETLPGVEYVPTFVAGIAGKPVDLVRGQASPLIMAVRKRLSFMRTREIRQAQLAKAEIEEQLRHNAWEMTDLADSTCPAVVTDLLAARDWREFLQYIVEFANPTADADQPGELMRVAQANVHGHQAALGKATKRCLFC